VRKPRKRGAFCFVRREEGELSTRFSTR
jgi:hypothetical protein